MVKLDISMPSKCGDCRFAYIEHTPANEYCINCFITKNEIKDPDERLTLCPLYEDDMTSNDVFVAETVKTIRHREERPNFEIGDEVCTEKGELGVVVGYEFCGLVNGLGLKVLSGDGTVYEGFQSPKAWKYTGKTFPIMKMMESLKVDRSTLLKRIGKNEN